MESTPRDRGKSIRLCLLFFCSGASGLIYQVVWVREFGWVFGNTVYSASIVVAVFMLGLGAGSYIFGAVADRRQSTLRSPNNQASDGWQATRESLIGLYAGLETIIAALGLGLSFLLPHLGTIVARLSWYVTASNGWQLLSFGSYVSRGVIAVVLLTPITVLMGGTLTVLVRALVRANLENAGSRVALLYGVNTLGAAAGALLTDFALVPAIGLLMTQLVAVGLNVVAAGGAFLIAHADSRAARRGLARNAEIATGANGGSTTVAWTAAALALSGFAALGMEIVWLRHLGVLLGGFRAVFSLLLTVMLVALGAGALAGGWIDRRFHQPSRSLMFVQALFAAAILAGLASGDAEALARRGVSLAATLGALSPASRTLTEIWFNLQPMILEVALPSFVGGLAFPLANAIVQHAEAAVGRRAGILYLANTVGAVCGSLVTGYVLLPLIGMQASAALLAAVAAFSIGPLYRAHVAGHAPVRRMELVGAGLVAALGVGIWLSLPADFIVSRALGARDSRETILTVSEGVTELIAVVERPERGRGLLTNGHAMSSTAMLDQRYMRALAHIPLLSMNAPRRVLVIGFGVGNTAHAASLHTSVSRVDVADLSRRILDHAGYFRDANRDVLQNPKVTVFLNDGRQHLQMANPGTYDLITLEPPPIAHAGVAALYSREFYQLARSRLTTGGYISQWLPAYQVPADSSLAMVRAFLDVFPQSVLLSGAQAELLLIGTAAPHIELDPDRVAMMLDRETQVREDLLRIDLGSVREIAGSFVGSAAALERATRESPAVTDDRPLQEYGVISGLSTGLMGVPSSLFEVTNVAAWCPRCLSQDEGGASVANLDLYLRLLQQAYVTPVAAPPAAASTASGSRRLMGSRYLGAVVPDSAEAHNLLGLLAMREDRVDEGVREFETALAKEPGSPNARANLGQIRYEQGAALLESRQFKAAADALRAAVDLAPDSAEAHNDLGVALASMGRVSEARAHFERAVAIAPRFAEAKRNLESAKITRDLATQ